MRPEAEREAGPPPGYLEVRSPGGTWVARPGCAGVLRDGAADVLLRGGVPRGAGDGRGRGGMVAMRFGADAVVAKPALHGGLLAPLLDGLYLGPGRARAQLGLSAELRRRGIETPEVLAVGWRRVLGPLVRQAIVTRAVPGGRNLLEAARSLDRRSRRGVVAAGADAVRALHDAGFVHADLNLMNLVLEPRPDGALVHVVDLDRGRFAGRPGTGSRLCSLARLLRSHDKWVGADRRLTPREEIRFLRRYCRSDRVLLRTLIGGLRRARRRHQAFRAIRRRLGGG